jgi:hypothetical protein
MAMAFRDELTQTMFGDVSPRSELRYAGATKLRGLRPTAGRLLIRVEPDPPAADSLIVIAAGSEAERRRVRCGMVVARPVGDGGSSEPQARIGDVVLFPAGSGQGLRLRIEGREHLRKMSWAPLRMRNVPAGRKSLLGGLQRPWERETAAAGARPPLQRAGSPVAGLLARSPRRLDGSGHGEYGRPVPPKTIPEVSHEGQTTARSGPREASEQR